MQQLVEMANAEIGAVHRCQHLDILQWIESEAGGNAVALIRGEVERGTTFLETGLTIFGSEDLFESPENSANAC